MKLNFITITGCLIFTVLFSSPALSLDIRSKISLFDKMFGNSASEKEYDSPTTHANSGDGFADVLESALRDSGMFTEPKALGDFHNTASIVIVDRLVGQPNSLDVSLEAPKQHGDLVVRLLSCWKEFQNKYRPDSKALIEVYSVHDDQLEKIFTGWILSNHPALSNYKHDKYDIILKTCIDK